MADRSLVVIQVDVSFGSAVDGNGLAHQAGSLGAGQQLQQLPLVADAVVGTHFAGLVYREVVGGIKVRRQWHPDVPGIGSRLSEASVVACHEGGQPGVSRLQRGDASQTQFLG